MTKRLGESSSKGIDSSSDVFQKLTDLQRQVLSLMLNEHLSQIQVANRLQTSKQNVNQVVKRLKKIGVLDSQNFTALLRGGAVTRKLTSTAKWRYHKLHFVLKHFYFEPR